MAANEVEPCARAAHVLRGASSRDASFRLTHGSLLSLTKFELYLWLVLIIKYIILLCLYILLVKAVLLF